MVFDRLFGWTKKKEKDPDIQFGRYSDNNKSVDQVEKWTEAGDLFKDKQYLQSFEAFFQYLLDHEQGNVIFEQKDDIASFILYQGSKLVRGEIGKEYVRASITLARMPEPSIPVMRRLLEMNFHLYYSRFMLEEDKICMLFDSEISTASPNKLYYGLKELATRADKQDDLLLTEFGYLEPADVDHIVPLPDKEKAIKYLFLRRWIESALQYIPTLDPEKFSGGISYLLLSLVFRIDYLISPEGKILNELEKIASAYYNKDDQTSPQRNPGMIEGFQRILEKSSDEIFNQFFRSKYTFAIVPPQNLKAFNETIDTALQNMIWYKENNYPDIANKVMEYGFAYNQYSFSLPRPLGDLFRLFMQVNYSEYFRELGFATEYYAEAESEFREGDIKDRIEEIMEQWRPKYPALQFRTRKLRFDSMLSFNHSFLQEITQLIFE